MRSFIVLTALVIMLGGVPAGATDIDAAPTIAPSAYLQQGGDAPPDATGGKSPRMPHHLHSPRPAHLPRPARTRPGTQVLVPAVADHQVSFNPRSHKYHEKGCKYWSGRADRLMSASEAIAKGGKPCQWCH